MTSASGGSFLGFFKASTHLTVLDVELSRLLVEIFYRNIKLNRLGLRHRR